MPASQVSLHRPSLCMLSSKPASKHASQQASQQARLQQPCTHRELPDASSCIPDQGPRPGRAAGQAQAACTACTACRGLLHRLYCLSWQRPVQASQALWRDLPLHDVALQTPSHLFRPGCAWARRPQSDLLRRPGLEPSTWIDAGRLHCAHAGQVLDVSAMDHFLWQSSAWWTAACMGALQLVCCWLVKPWHCSCHQPWTIVCFNAAGCLADVATWPGFSPILLQTEAESHHPNHTSSAPRQRMRHAPTSVALSVAKGCMLRRAAALPHAISTCRRPNPPNTEGHTWGITLQFRHPEHHSNPPLMLTPRTRDSGP